MYITSSSEQLQIRQSVLLQSQQHNYRIMTLPLRQPSDSASVLQSLKFSFRLGDPHHAAHDNHYRYALPYKKGKSYRLIQGFYGSYSHSEAHSVYALDFAMPVGDTICAARPGQVVWVVERFSKGQPDEALLDKANQVVVMHADGSLAFYSHIQQDGSLVKIGEQVATGQAIATSGHTGYSSQPHLHFVVRVPTEETLAAVPVRFGRLPRVLKTGRYYHKK